MRIAVNITTAIALGIAAILLILVNLLEATGIISQLMILYLPIILNELVLAIWLMVKGFNPSAIKSKTF